MEVCAPAGSFTNPAASNPRMTALWLRRKTWILRMFLCPISQKSGCLPLTLHPCDVGANFILLLNVLCFRFIGKARPLLFDHLVSAGQQRGRHAEAEGLSGFKVDHQLILGWQLDRKIARLLAIQNAGDIDTSTTIGIRLARAITD